MEAALKEYLKDFKKKEETTPSIGCVCIAAPVKDNCTESMANARWKKQDGNQIAINLGLKKLKLLNDFEAVGYGL